MAKKKLKAPPGRSGPRSSAFGWWLGVSAVVVAGLVLIVMSRGSRPEADTSVGPPINAHWHAVVGVYACGDWVLPHPPQLTPLPDPHTHADGIIHAEPLSSASANARATLSRFADVGGRWSVSSTRLKLWTGKTYENGDRCESLENKPGEVRWTVNGEPQVGSPGDYVVEDGDVVVLAFMPKGEDFPTLPPWAGTLAENGSPVNHPDFLPPEPEGGAPTSSTTAQAPTTQAPTTAASTTSTGG
jgi:hypothetical protein